jgi:putative SOS response-associated peptidase YedK
VASLFEVDPIDIGPARFNIAPTQPIVTVRARREPAAERATGQDAAHAPGGPVARELAIVRWGLIPWWAKPGEAKKIASKCIQARAETAPRSPAFRDAFKRHRCLVVVDGFFEWKTLPDGRRVPHHVRRRSHAPFAIAAVWDSWRPPEDAAPDGPKPDRIAPSAPTTDSDRVESAAVLTTRSGGPIRALHDRMPLILPANEWNTWLGGSVEDAAQLLEQDQGVLDQRAAELVAVPVSSWVNNVRHEDPRCIEPVSLAPDGDSAAGAPKQIDFDFAPSRSAAGATKGRRQKR